jgi:pimeloyl-ACP methyl ester carboxylesterase
MNTSTPLLLLPGLMNDARVWRHIPPALGTDRKIHVAPTHLHSIIGDSAREAIAAMPPGPFAVAGFSLGGYVALEAWRQASSRIAGIGLLDTSARADSDDVRLARLRMVDAMGSGARSLREVAGGFAERVVHPSRLQDQQLLAVLADMAAALGAEGFVRQQQAAMDRSDSRHLLQDMTVPSLVLCGREDQVTPLALSEEMAGLLPLAELVVVENSGQMTTLEQPGAVIAAVRRWLARVDSRGPL